METSERMTVRWWRWRRNVLKRRVDVVEAWVVLVGWVLALLVGVVAGLVAAGTVEQAVVRQRAESRQVPAVVVKDAPGPASARPIFWPRPSRPAPSPARPSIRR